MNCQISGTDRVVVGPFPASFRHGDGISSGSRIARRARKGDLMPRTARRTGSALAVIALVLVALTEIGPRVSGQAPSGFPSKQNGEWAFYNADIRGSRYMPFDQINASNFNKLEVAWHLKTDNFGP